MQPTDATPATDALDAEVPPAKQRMRHAMLLVREARDEVVKHLASEKLLIDQHEHAANTIALLNRAIDMVRRVHNGDGASGKRYDAEARVVGAYESRRDPDKITVV